MGGERERKRERENKREEILKRREEKRNIKVKTVDKEILGGR